MPNSAGSSTVSNISDLNRAIAAANAPGAWAAQRPAIPRSRERAGALGPRQGEMLMQ